MHHSKPATGILSSEYRKGRTHITLIQEPYFYNGASGFNKKDGIFYCDTKGGRPRAAIFARKDLNVLPLPNLSCRDLFAILFKYKSGYKDRQVIISSVYLPGDSLEPPPTTELVKLVEYSKVNKIPLLIGMDANSHHVIYGSSNTNLRGVSLLEFIVSNELNILNEGNRPTFINSIREEVLDITICTSDVVNEISNWHVSLEPSLSDHRTIKFTLSGDPPQPIKSRNSQDTNWSFFKERLKGRMSNWNKTISNKKEIDEAVNSLTANIINCFKIACPLKTFSGSRKDNLSPELWKLRKEARRAWNHRKNNQEAYKNALKAYKKALVIFERDSWQEFCKKADSISAVARISKLLVKEPCSQVSVMKLANGEYIHEENKVLQHLMENHFPGCKIFDIRPNISPTASRLDWENAKSIVSEDGIRWAVNSFKPFKSAGEDEIFPALLQCGLDVIIKPLQKIFTASLHIKKKTSSS